AFVALFIPGGFSLGGDGPKTALAASVGLGNISLYLSDQGYFNERLAFNAFSHTWSLGVEEQFYLLFPLLLWLGMWAAARSVGWRGRLLAIAAIAIPTVFSFGWSVWESSANPIGAFYLLTSRFWELGAGALLALAFAFGLIRPPQGRRVGAFLVVGATAVAWALLFAEQASFPFPWAIPAVMGTGLIIAALQGDPDGLPGLGKSVFHNPFAITVGDWSYSLYLWHWAFIVFLRWTLGLELWWHYVLATVLTFLFGWMSYRFVEQPILRRSFHVSLSPRKLVAAAAATTVFVAGSLYLGDRATEPFLSLSVTAQGEIFDPPASVGDPEEEYAHYGGWGDGRNVIVVGDSHARHFGTLLTELRAASGFEYRVLDDRECRVVGLLSAREGCSEYQDVVKEIIASSNPGDLVLFSSLRTPRISSLINGQTQSQEQTLEGFMATQTPEVHEQVLEDARGPLTELKEAGLFVVITSPTPVFPSPVFRCADWFNQMNPQCQGGFSVSREYIKSLAAPANQRIDILEQEGLVTRWDTFSTLCPGSECSTLLNEHHLFFDGDHLSRWGNYLLMPSFLELVSAEWGHPSA
ncbi:acyltransferase family protein, partial [Pontimonas sp.]|uniref:acyltransferase family protein n=1 Tax=Pontimonas sp. TaxID=2304492 RepID=UPI0028701F84